MEYSISNLSSEEVSTISKSHGFSGFLTASQIIQATTAVASTDPGLALETQRSGNLQPSGVEVPNSELAIGPVVLSTPLGGPADGPTEPAKAGQLGPEAVRSPELMGGPLAHSTPLGKPTKNLADSAKAEEAESEAGSQMDKAARKKAKRRRHREKKRLISQLAKLSTVQNIPESSRTASKRGRNSSGNNKSEHSEPAPKRGKNDNDPNSGRGNSPENNSKAEGRDQEEPPPSRPSFAEAAKRSVCLVVTPLDLKGNTIGAVAEDRIFIMEMIEKNITSGTPKIVIQNIKKQGLGLRIECLGPEALDFVKGVISPLKGPSKLTNQKGYQCLGPGDRPPFRVYGVWAERPILSKSKFVELILNANEWIKQHMLHVVKACHKKVGGDTKGVTFLVGVTPELKAKLEECNFRLNYGAGRIAHFKDKPKPKGNRGNP